MAEGVPEEARVDSITALASIEGSLPDGLLAAFDAYERALAADDQAALAAAFEPTATVLRADAFMDLAEVLRTAGRPNESAPFVAQALELYEQKGNMVAAGRARRILDA